MTVLGTASGFSGEVDGATVLLEKDSLDLEAKILFSGDLSDSLDVVAKILFSGDLSDSLDVGLSGDLFAAVENVGLETMNPPGVLVV